jgi:hypothetical protein
MIVNRDYFRGDEHGTLEVRLYHRKKVHSFRVEVRTVSNADVKQGSYAWDIMTSLSVLIMGQSRNGDPLEASNRRPYSAAGQMAKAILQNSPHVYKLRLTEYGVDPRQTDRVCPVQEAVELLWRGCTTGADPKVEPSYGWMYYGGSGDLSNVMFMDEDNVTGLMSP